MRINKLETISLLHCSRAFLILASLGSSGAVFGQSELSILAPQPPPVVGRFLEPFHVQQRIVPPVRLTNSPRLDSLIRAGSLYLSAPDVIALVLENNLDIAVQR